MHVKSALRVFAGLGVAGALVVATAIPATAKAAAELGVYFADTTIATGGDGKIEGPVLYASEPVLVPEATVTYDATALAGKVEISEEGDLGDCTSPSANILVCKKWYEIEVDEWGIAGYFQVEIKATPSASAGDSGTLKVTFDAPGYAPATHEARVRVGEGVDLASGTVTEVSAKPGSAFTAPAVVKNAGETVAQGASVVFYNDYAIRAAKHYSNCTYVGDELRTCTFDTDLAPGATYTASLAYALGADTYAPGKEWGQTAWMTPAEFEDFVSYLDANDVTIGKPGTDGELRLTTMSSAQARNAQADIDLSNNWGELEVTVTGKNGADLAAIGAELGGDAGDVVPAEIGLVNKGPAAIDHGRSGEPITRVNVKVPTGTTAVAVPEDCFPAKDGEVDWEHPGKVGAGEYLCHTDIFLAPDDAQLFPFDLRIDKVIANATGTVTINAKCECPGFTGDLDPSNDTAKILVNGSGGGGGSLPTTGASTGLVAGAGALLLLAGAAGFVIARRRRMRFVA